MIQQVFEIGDRFVNSKAFDTSCLNNFRNQIHKTNKAKSLIFFWFTHLLCKCIVLTFKM